MKLYNGMSPNGARVAIFKAEKGIDLPTTPIDVLSGEAQSETYLKINPLGEVPALALDDGQIITESIAICRYLDVTNDGPSLFGIGAQGQAVVEMWNRRMELRVFNVIGAVGRHEFPLFKDRYEQMPDYAASQRRLFAKRLEWLDGELADGRTFIAGNKFSVADITGMAVLMICMFSGTDIPADLTHLKKWENTVKSRASWPQMPG